MIPEQMAIKMGMALGLLLLVVFLVYVVAQYLSTPVYAPALRGSAPATLPCMGDNHCPMGQKCAGGICIEAFTSHVGPSQDMSSCASNECNGINQPCARTASPCGEGTFCQKNSCVKIQAPDQGEAYQQIGMISL